MRAFISLRDILMSAVIFLIPFFIYSISTYFDYTRDLNDRTYRKVLPSYDVVSNTYLPYILIKEHTLDFGSISKSIKIFDDASKESPYFLIKSGDHYFSSYPIITGLLASFVYFPVIILNKIPELTYAENILKVALLGRVTASIIASLSVLLFYKLISAKDSNRIRALIFTAFYAFGTGTFSVSSRGLWLHTLTQLIFTLVLLLLNKEKKSNATYTIIGFLLGLNVLNRITNIVFALVIFLFYLLHEKNKAKYLVYGALPTVVYMLTYNTLFFGSPFTEGYAARDGANVWTANLFESVPGMFISPARGYLFISPVLLLGFVSMLEFVRTKDNLKMYLSAAFLLSLLMMAKWYTWHGANAFGNRMLVDYQPFLAYFAYLSFRKLDKKQFVFASLLILFSFYVHFNAVFYRNARCSESNNWNFRCLTLPGS